MSRIVLDTSVIVPDFRLRSTRLRAVLVSARELRDSVAIPSVVVDEVVNKFREEISVATSGLRDAEARLGKLLGQEVSPLECEPAAELEKYRAWLTAKLKSGSIDVLDYPDIDHRDVVNRALTRRKPFTKDGQRGYRDALIWETLLNQLRVHRDELFFVSANTSDFADPDNKQQLHPDLERDLKELKPPRAQLLLFSSLDDLLARGIGPRNEVVPDLKAQIEAGRLGTLDLHPWLLEELPKLIRGSRLMWVGRPTERHRGDWTVTNLQYVRAPQLQSTNNLTEKSILIVLALLVRATFVPSQPDLGLDVDSKSDVGFAGRLFATVGVEVERDTQRALGLSVDHIVALEEAPQEATTEALTTR
jgi:predicted nucleic acid-binding protein